MRLHTLLGMALSIAYFNNAYADNISMTNNKLSDAWNYYQEKTNDALMHITNSPYFSKKQDKAEGYRHIFSEITQSTQAVIFSNDNYPTFQFRPNQKIKIGLDNPDNAYFTSQISPENNYLIEGDLGSTATFAIQSLAGVPGYDGAGTSKEQDSLDNQTITTDRDGRFKIFIGEEKPDNLDEIADNFLKTGYVTIDSLKKPVQTLLVRYSYNDWNREQKGNIHITKLDKNNNPVTGMAPNLTVDDIADNIKVAGDQTYETTVFWDEFAQKLDNMFASNYNKFTAPSATDGGLKSQFSATAVIDLPKSDKEVLMVTTYPSDAEYQGFQLGNMWYESLDYKTHQTSLTSKQSYLTHDKEVCSIPAGAYGPGIPAETIVKDSCYRYVVSAEDPEVKNWLDTTGHHKVFAFLRWQGGSTHASDYIAPWSKVVKMKEVKSLFKMDERVHGSDREKQLRDRYTAVQQRYQE
ncbi:hypothetical protein CI610_03185 [invertebrate metagenome]|uniref:DUF1214 domain-containing protein n=1 Tax=invertebrate metagenome TaxID=1711999 RepID=A0A2H9T3U7_9ZZZZ